MGRVDSIERGRCSIMESPKRSFVEQRAQQRFQELCQHAFRIFEQYPPRDMPKGVLLEACQQFEDELWKVFTRTQDISTSVEAAKVLVGFLFPRAYAEPYVAMLEDALQTEHTEVSRLNKEHKNDLYPYVRALYSTAVEQYDKTQEVPSFIEIYLDVIQRAGMRVGARNRVKDRLFGSLQALHVEYLGQMLDHGEQGEQYQRLRNKVDFISVVLRCLDKSALFRQRA